MKMVLRGAKWLFSVSSVSSEEETEEAEEAPIFDRGSLLSFYHSVEEL